MNIRGISVLVLITILLASCTNDTKVSEDAVTVESTQAVDTTVAEENNEESVGEEVIAEDVTSEVAQLVVTFTDPAWDGAILPEGQHCSMFDGEGDSPEMLIENIPEGTRFIEIWYNDRTFAANDDGGHGKVAITVEPGETSITVPSFAGESLDLPENMFVIEAARSSRANGGAYLPPCSGGAGNEYYISFFAYDSEYTEVLNLLGTGNAEMGVY